MRSSPKMFSTNVDIIKIYVNQIKIKIIGYEQNSNFSCSINAEFEQGVKDQNNSGYTQYQNRSVSKKCEGVKSIFLNKICERFKNLMKEHLEKSDRPVDLYIEIF